MLKLQWEPEFLCFAQSWAFSGSLYLVSPSPLESVESRQEVLCQYKVQLPEGLLEVVKELRVLVHVQ